MLPHSVVRKSSTTTMLLINFYIIVLLLSSSCLAANYFCNFKCGKEHTVCALPNCGPASHCGRYFKMLPFTDEDRTIILALHNEKRNYVASGKETRHGNGKASNMNVFSYSKELEFVAQCWANNCTYGGHSCLSTKKFPGFVGQNRKQFFLNADSDLTATSLLRDTIFDWYSYISDTNAELIDNLAPDTGTEYSQIMYAKTTHIGCGRTSYGNFADAATVLIVCNYGGGHLKNVPVYLRGEPCSDCPICNKQYTSLCGEIEDFTKDDWTFPQEDYSDVPKNMENSQNEKEVLQCHYSNEEL